MKSTARETLRYMAETNAAIRVTSHHWHHQCDDSGSNTPDIESSLCLFKPDVCILSWTNEQGPRTMYIQSQVSIQCTSKGTNHTVEYQLVVHVWNQHCDSEWSDLLTLFSSLRRRTHKHSLRIANWKGPKARWFLETKTRLRPMKSTARETLRYMAETNAAIRVTSRHWHHQCDDSGSNTPDIESSLCLFKPDVCILSWTNEQAKGQGQCTFKVRCPSSAHQKEQIVRQNISCSACLESTLWFRVEWFVNIVLIIAPQNSQAQLEDC